MHLPQSSPDLGSLPRPMPPPKFSHPHGFHPFPPQPPTGFNNYPPHQFVGPFTPLSPNLGPRMHVPSFYSAIGHPDRNINQNMPLIPPQNPHPLKHGFGMGQYPNGYPEGSVRFPFQDLQEFKNHESFEHIQMEGRNHQFRLDDKESLDLVHPSSQTNGQASQNNAEILKSVINRGSPSKSNQSFSSESSTNKEIFNEMDKLRKKKESPKIMIEDEHIGNGENSEKVISPDLQSQETKSGTPDNETIKEEDLKKISNNEKITKLFDMFKAKQMNKQKLGEAKPVTTLKNKDSPLMSITSKYSQEVQNHSSSNDYNIKMEETQSTLSLNILKNISINEKEINVGRKVENCLNIIKSQEILKNSIIPSEKKEMAESIKEKEHLFEKSKYDNGSANELLLKQLKSALPQTQFGSAENVKNLVNLYLKLSKNPNLQSSV